MPRKPLEHNRLLVVSSAVVLILVSYFLASFCSRPPELMWKGKPASYWIARLSFPDLPEAAGSSAEEFIFAAGPEVVAELTGGLSLRDNWVNDRLAGLYFKLPIKAQRLFPMPANRVLIRAHCARGLGLLGPAASNAIPALLKSLSDDELRVRMQSAEALGRIGFSNSQVRDVLVSHLSSTNSGFRVACAIGLAHFLPNSQVASALRSSMSDTNVYVRFQVAESLWRDDSNPQATVDVLKVALKDSEKGVRFYAAQSLGKLGYHQDLAAETLALALEAETRAGGNETWPVRGQPQGKMFIWTLIQALGRLGPFAKSAIPVLTPFVAQTNRTGTLSVLALARIEPANPRWQKELEARLDGEDAGLVTSELGRRTDVTWNSIGQLRRLEHETHDWSTRMTAAIAAWRLDPLAPNPLKRIVDELPKQATPCLAVIEVLGELGSAARATIPALQQMRYCHGVIAHDYANEALKKIAPEYVANPWLN